MVGGRTRGDRRRCRRTLVSLLLDTHALLWLVLEPSRLSDRARSEITSPDAVVRASHVSLWELAIKRASGRLDVLDRPALEWFEHYTKASGVRTMTIQPAHLGAVEHLPDHHRDPFDRLLVAQARHDGLTIVTAEELVMAHDVECVW